MKNILFVSTAPTRVHALKMPLEKTGYPFFIYSLKFNRLKELFNLISFIQSHSISLIIIDNSDERASLIRDASILCGVPYYIFMRGDIWMELSERIPANSNKFTERLKLYNKNLSGAQRIITVSFSLGRIVEKNVPECRDKWVNIPIHIDTSYLQEFFSETFVSRFKLNRKKYILSATNFDYKQKIEGMIHFSPLMKEIQTQYPDIQWVICGDGIYKPFFEAEIKRHNLNVTLTGIISKEEILCGYKNASLFLHISYFDAFPNVIIEAMALGCTVVSTDIGGVPEMIDDGKTGFIIEQGNHPKMRDVIMSILKNPDIAIDIKNNAKSAVIKRFSIEIIAKRYKELLQIDIDY